MFKYFIKLLDRIFAVVGALLFSQIPLFMHQYLQGLIGHEAELRLQVEEMRRAAMQTGKTLEQFINKFLASGDIDFELQGAVMKAMLNRWQYLSDNLISLNNSTVFTRPFVFISHLDFDIAKSSLTNFEPGIPFSLEGGVYLMIGMLFGLLIFYSLRKFFVLTSKFLNKALRHRTNI